jgi:hypothetical protein
MVKRWHVLLVVFAVLASFGACSDPPPPPPPPPHDAAPPIVCCPPSSQPECCMQLGGTQVGSACPELTCNIPSPTAVGWKLGQDTHGCPQWFVPPGPFACGPPDAALPCAPQDVSSYHPSPLTPPNAPADVCTSQDLAAFYQACMIGGVNSAACSAFVSLDAGACGACLLSRSADPTWGPVVVEPDQTKLNVAGCVAIVTGDSSSTSCAQRINAELGCEAKACDAVCPMNVDGGTVAYQNCALEVATTTCRPYLDAECDPTDAGITKCTQKTTGQAGFMNIASVFCGGQ